MAQLETEYRVGAGDDSGRLIRFVHVGVQAYLSEGDDEPLTTRASMSDTP
jgi:hypothetical protein